MKKLIYLIVLLIIVTSCGRYNYIPRQATDIININYPSSKKMNPIANIPHDHWLAFHSDVVPFKEPYRVKLDAKSNITLQPEQNTALVATPVRYVLPENPKTKESPVTREIITKRYKSYKAGLLVSILLLLIAIPLATASTGISILLIFAGVLGLFLFPSLLLGTFLADKELRKKEEEVKANKTSDEETKNDGAKPEDERKSTAAKPGKKGATNGSDSESHKKTEKKKADEPRKVGWAWLTVSFFLANILVWLSVKDSK